MWFPRCSVLVLMVILASLLLPTDALPIQLKDLDGDSPPVAKTGKEALQILSEHKCITTGERLDVGRFTELYSAANSELKEALGLSVTAEVAYAERLHSPSASDIIALLDEHKDGVISKGEIKRNWFLVELKFRGLIHRDHLMVDSFARRFGELTSEFPGLRSETVYKGNTGYSLSPIESLIGEELTVDILRKNWHRLLPSKHNKKFD